MLLPNFQSQPRRKGPNRLLLLCPGLSASQPEAARPDGPSSVEQHAPARGPEDDRLEQRPAPALPHQRLPVPEHKTEQPPDEHDRDGGGLLLLHADCQSVQHWMLCVDCR